MFHLAVNDPIRSLGIFVQWLTVSYVHWIFRLCVTIGTAVRGSNLESISQGSLKSWRECVGRKYSAMWGHWRSEGAIMFGVVGIW